MKINVLLISISVGLGVALLGGLISGSTILTLGHERSIEAASGLIRGVHLDKSGSLTIVIAYRSEGQISLRRENGNLVLTSNRVGVSIPRILILEVPDGEQVQFQFGSPEEQITLALPSDYGLSITIEGSGVMLSASRLGLVSADLNGPLALYLDNEEAGQLEVGRVRAESLMVSGSDHDDTIRLSGPIETERDLIVRSDTSSQVSTVFPSGASGRLIIDGLLTSHAAGVFLSAPWLENRAGVTAREGQEGGRIVIHSRMFMNLDGDWLEASGNKGGRIEIYSAKLLNTGRILADAHKGEGGQINIHLTGRGIQTAHGLMSVRGGLQGSGGTILITSADVEQTNNHHFSNATYNSDIANPGLFLSGYLDASAAHAGQKGGTVVLLGPSLDLAGASVDANGHSGGGTILVGGEAHGEKAGEREQGTGVSNSQNVNVTFSTRLMASAIHRGDGGRVVVWGDERVVFSGSISAQGGPTVGDGGWVEVSAGEELAATGKVVVSAQKGKVGEVLLDPESIIIDAVEGVFPQFELIDPNAGGGTDFGWWVVPLSTGNVVVAKPGDNFGASEAGAVYLYDGLTGALISTLTGSTAGDQVGYAIGQVDYDFTALSNGNYVVLSRFWDNGSIEDAGAATWGDGDTGVSGAVSEANSLVGSTADDKVGLGGVTALSNGNYVVESSQWDNGGVLNAGAATWGNGDTGVSGAVSAANSLVGSSANDWVGLSVTALSNGNYVVMNPYWVNGGVDDAGAATWGNGDTGVSGAVSAANSLVGSSADDGVGGVVTALSNGNYVVSSRTWDNGGTADVGAVTWGDGDTGTIGVVSAANSLVGSTADDRVGMFYVLALSNGNYVVGSRYWDNEGRIDAGAATWGDGDTGTIGEVSAANSLVGNTAGDQVGYSITALSNGNYVVSSPNFDKRGTADVGAVTWGNGGTGTIGLVSTANSLVGSTAGDQAGFGGVAALSNGNYVVRSYYWDNGLIVDAGAATWVDGTQEVIGTVSAANSLVGSTVSDQVGQSVTVLSNGNYVVKSQNWDNGGATNVGAATWGDGETGINGVVSAANSLVGSTADDRVTNNGVIALSNGDYVVSSRYWDNGGVANVGAATWGDGDTGTSGVVNAANSLVGSTAYDHLGGLVTALSNGNYVVGSSDWDSVGLTDAGVAAWVNGAAGQTIEGNVAAGPLDNQNSITGQASDAGFETVVEDTVNGSFLVSFISEGSGKVRVGLVEPNQLTFSRAQGAALWITPAFVENTLNQGSDVTLQASQVIGFNNSLLVDNPGGDGGSLTLEAVEAITFSGAISLSSDNGAVTFNGPMTVTNPVSVDAGNGAINFTDQLIVINETLVLTAGSPVQLGSGTHLDGGVLQVSSGVVVGDGDSLTGEGSVDGDVTVEAGGTLEPGLSAGSMDTGDLSLQSAASLGVELNGLTPGSQYDRVMVAGTVDLENSQLELSLSFSANLGDSFVIIDNDGSDAVSGTFNELAEGAIFNVDGIGLQINYQGGDGNDVQLTVVDVNSPSVVSVSPADGAVEVGVTAPLVINFSEAIDTTTFAISATPDPGGWLETWNSTNTEVTLSHNDFSSETVYNINLTAADDLAGIPLSGAPVAWSFTTQKPSTPVNGILQNFLPVVLNGTGD